MAKIKFTVNDVLVAKVSACAEELWPGESVRGLARFIRDAIRRYLRYCDGRS